MNPLPRLPPIVSTALLALVLAFAFLGTRGIWDPDEGRYTNVAMNMLDTGDWIHPRRSHEVGHWTKPPLTYWAIAASVATFGREPWAARLPAALAYLLCTWLAWRMARRLLPESRDGPVQAALVYATMLLPVGAAQMITTDYVLAACETLAMWGFVEARFGSSGRPRAWLVLMWLGFALAFLAKGPPALVPLLALLAFNLWVPGPRRHVFQWSGLLVFVLLALPWYVAVILDTPGLFRYFIGDEVVNRVTTNEFGRNGQWYGWLAVYLPTLLLGALPWTGALLRGAKGLPGHFRRWWREPAARAQDAPRLFLVLWLALPLLVFCLAQSRMPLYLLPLFAPLALLVARQRNEEGKGFPRAWRLLAWLAVVFALRIGAVHWPTHKDAATWAQAIRERSDGPVEEVVFVDDMARYGLHLELGAEVEKISLAPLPQPQPKFGPEYDEDLASELAEHEPGVVWVCKQAAWPGVQARVVASGYRVEVLGGPYEGRVLFRVERAAQEPGIGTRERKPVIPARS